MLLRSWSAAARALAACGRRQQGRWKRLFYRGNGGSGRKGVGGVRGVRGGSGDGNVSEGVGGVWGDNDDDNGR